MIFALFGFNFGAEGILLNMSCHQVSEATQVNRLRGICSEHCQSMGLALQACGTLLTLIFGCVSCSDETLEQRQLI